MTWSGVNVEALHDPPGLWITCRTPGYRRAVIEKLVRLQLDYTEHRTLFRSGFSVPLPDGKDTGLIREYLAQRRQEGAP